MSISYEKDKEHTLTSDGYASLQIDFAENYSGVWQDEGQSAHWCKNQVTIFTAVMWSKNLQIITITRKSQLPQGIKYLSIWSDGPSRQFKNRYVGVLLIRMAKNFMMQFRDYKI